VFAVGGRNLYSFTEHRPLPLHSPSFLSYSTRLVVESFLQPDRPATHWKLCCMHYKNPGIARVPAYTKDLRRFRVLKSHDLSTCQGRGLSWSYASSPQSAARASRVTRTSALAQAGATHSAAGSCLGIMPAPTPGKPASLWWQASNKHKFVATTDNVAACCWHMSWDHDHLKASKSRLEMER